MSSLAKTTPFTAESAQIALQAACEVAGLDCRQATFLRLGENAMYRVGDSVMARISRSVEGGHKEALVARWLADEGFPAGRLISRIEQPVDTNGLTVTFWEYIEERPEPVTAAEQASVLRSLHNLAAPTTFTLPPFEPMPKVEKRIQAVSDGRISRSTAEFLRDRHHALTERFSSLDFVLPPGPIHCDFHTGNLMRDQAGDVIMIDLEDFAWGPREWDVSVVGVRYQAFGWLTDDEYRSFVDTYGFDALTWGGFPTLRGIRELNMTTWLMQNLGQSPDLDAEVNKRLHDLRAGQSRRDWATY